MKKLKLNFKGVLQSWGSYGGGLNYHPTDNKPTESGILGMIAAGMGIDRSEEAKLQELRDSIEIDIPEPEEFPDIYHDFQVVSPQGTSFTDYLSASQMLPEDLRALPAASGAASSTGETKTISKDYILNQDYTVFIRGSEEVLNKVKHALQHPYYPIFLGRKCCTASTMEVCEVAA